MNRITRRDFFRRGLEAATIVAASPLIVWGLSRPVEDTRYLTDADSWYMGDALSATDLNSIDWYMDAPGADWRYVFGTSVT